MRAEGGPDAGRSSHGIDEDGGTVGGGDDRSNSRPRRHLRGGQLRRHPAPRPVAARAAGGRLELVVDLDHRLDQCGIGVHAWIGVEQARRIGEEHQQIRPDEMGDERSQAIVVAEADLVIGDGVVLVHDGHDAELEQPPERLAGMQVAPSMSEIERGQQHLADVKAERG